MLSPPRARACSSKDAATNPRGIPYAPFVDRVEDYVSSRADVEGALKSFQEMISYVPLTPPLFPAFPSGHDVGAPDRDMTRA